MSKPDERIKIIISKQNDKRELLDILRYDCDYYAMQSGQSTHYSYHSSGQSHTAVQHGSKKTYSQVRHGAPSKLIKGFETLASMTLTIGDSWHKKVTPLKQYFGKKVTSLVEINCDALDEGDNLIVYIGIAANILTINRKIREINIKHNCVLLKKVLLRHPNLPIMVALAHHSKKDLTNNKLNNTTGSSRVGSQLTIMSPSGGFGEPPQPFSKIPPALPFKVEPFMPLKKITLVCSPMYKSYIDVFNIRIVALMCHDTNLAPILILPVEKASKVTLADIQAYFNPELKRPLPAGEFRLFEYLYENFKTHQVNIETENYQISIKHCTFSRITKGQLMYPNLTHASEWKRIYEVEVVKISD